MNQTRHRFAGPALPVLLLLLVAQAAGRPSTESESDIASLPPDVDNVEIHHVKVVDGVMYEDHPVIMYKEDFVNEDYDPSKNETKVNHPKLYKNLKRIRHHHKRPASEPVAVEEKILFDVLPESPIIMGDDETGSDNFEVAQLVQPSKEEPLQKYPKKYHSRHRRQAYNPYASQPYRLPSYSYSPHLVPIVFQPNQIRNQVRGKPPIYQGKLSIWEKQKPNLLPTSTDNPIVIDNRDGFMPDENSLFHNSNPDNADFSVFDNPTPRPRPRPTSSPKNNINNWQSPPLEEPERAPVWGPSAVRRPNNEWSRPTSSPIAGARPITTRRPRPAVTTSAPPPQPTETSVSNCVWAIINCCSAGSNQIRYNCFEEFGCHGAFWDVNPCAAEIRNIAISRLPN